MEGTNGVNLGEYQYAEGDYAQGSAWAEIRGIGPEPRHARHEYLNALLTAAVNKIPENEEGPFEVRTTVYVKHSSPGWWDGFRVQLTGG